MLLSTTNKPILCQSRPKVSLLDYTREEVMSFLKARLQRDRVKEAYVFGSFARNEHSAWSDIDLIIVGDFSAPFVERPRDFFDLLDLGVAVNILVYTEQEFAGLMQSPTGFWKEVSKEMARIH